MPPDPESFLGVDPQPSGSPPASPASPETPDARLARLSLKAFVVGVVVIAVGWALLWVTWGFPPVVFVILVGYLFWIVSIFCGLRVVESRQYVLWWVIPADLCLVYSLVQMDPYIGGIIGGAGFFGILLVVVVPMALSIESVAARPEATRTLKPKPANENHRGEAEGRLDNTHGTEAPFEAGPERSGPPPEPSPAAATLENLRTEASLGAFALGLLLAAAEFGLVFRWSKLGGFSMFGLQLLLHTSVIAAAVFSLTASMVSGLRVVKTNRQVLRWVIPTAALFIVAIRSVMHGPAQWLVIAALLIGALVAAPMPSIARWVYVGIFARVGRLTAAVALAAWRWQTKRRQEGETPFKD